MLHNVQAFHTVVLHGVATSTNGADHTGGWLTAALGHMTQAVAAGTLGEHGMGDILTDLQGPVTKHVGRVTDEVGQLGPILIKECKRYGAVARALSPGHQPVGVTEDEEVLAGRIAIEFLSQGLHRGERGLRGIPHGGDTS